MTQFAQLGRFGGFYEPDKVIRIGALSAAKQLERVLAFKLYIQSLSSGAQAAQACIVATIADDQVRVAFALWGLELRTHPTTLFALSHLKQWLLDTC